MLRKQELDFHRLNHLFSLYIYRKTSDRSRVPDRRRAPHTGRGSDSFVLIEAGPRLQAGSRIQAGGLVKYGYCLLVKQQAMTSFPQ